ncbi:hypothetical protein RMSM_03567 [Rhodopirellula maiorica SM1]|uniref:Uncharacterized protein n=1 Tax=Rhodopirellula maiorica SM1 TaxID=1265738 RepID=M5S008_9BACT|nr:hypothetical protein RMSM_03567 [Rhodopirellula maiorica SM1]
MLPVSFAQEPARTATEIVESEEKPIDFWMEKKLDYSTAILRGLAMQDFDEIQANAQKMRVLNTMEGFVRSRNKEYRKHVNTFQVVTDELITQSKQKNIDGVTLAFNQLTVSCVRCHQSLREDGDSDAETTLSVPSTRR